MRVWGADGMLNIKIKSFLFVGTALLASCSVFTPKVADAKTPGLMEGIYHFKSIENEDFLPEGWTFDDKSYFEFKKYADGKYDKHTILPNGSWGMHKWDYNNDNPVSSSNEYVMEWHNTPFDKIRSLHVGGYESLNDNTVFYPMAQCETEKTSDPNWCGFNDVFIYIHSVNKHEFSKRNVKIFCRTKSFDENFSVTFSNE